MFIRGFRWWQSLPLFAPDGGGGGGGGGSDDGGPFTEIPDGSEPTTDQVGQATEWLKSNTENFDARQLEGKKPGEIWNLARTGHIEAAKRDPFKGTEWQGQKIPDKFVETRDGKKVVKSADLLKSYTELERSSMRRREEVAAEVRTTLEAERKARAPAAPGDYVSGEKMKFGDREGIGLKIGDRTMEVFENDPAMVFLKGVAHEYGMPKEEFPKLVAGYISAAVSAGPKWSEEAEKLGGEVIGEKREQRVVGFLKANLSPDNYNWFARQPSTAASIQAIEQLMTLSGHPPFVPEKGDVPGSVFSKDELRTMQRDPRYTGEGRPGGPDKAFVAQVRQGYARLSKQG